MSKKPEPYLINNFLQNKCTPEDAEIVVNYFDKHPGALNDYFDANEWEQVTLTKILSAQKKLQLKKTIDLSVFEKKKVVSIAFVRYAVAAAMIGIIALAAFWFIRLQKPAHTWVKNIEAFEIINNTISKMDTILPDGSFVQLSPKAKIVYTNRFSEDRTVQLTGQALFEEKNISARPFTVMAQGIATTPIGTKFLVNSSPANRRVTVNLIEGNVKVFSAVSGKQMRDVYLKPGQTVSVNVETMAITLKDFAGKDLKQPPMRKKTEKANAHKQAKPVDVIWNNNAISFKKANLFTVFNKIAQQYNIHLVFDNEEIKTHHFTGEIYYTDAPETLIKNICDVSGLHYKQTADTFYIRKQ